MPRTYNYQQIVNAWEMSNPENTLQYCAGGCGQLKDDCICEQLEEAKKKLIFKKEDDTTVGTYGK